MSTIPFSPNVPPSQSAEVVLAAETAGEPLVTTGNYPAGVPRRLTYPTFPAYGLLELAATSVPDRPAAEMSGVSMTYAQVQHAAVQLASWLQQSGLEPGDRVALLLPNMPEYMIALNAIWRAGGVVVALSPLSVAEEVAAMLKSTRCQRVICLDMLTPLLSDVDDLKQTTLVSLREYLPLWKKIAYSAALWNRTGHMTLPANASQAWMWDAIEHADGQLSGVRAADGSAPAYILSTGGTTGSPKAVTLSHRNVVANAWQTSRWAGGTLGKETMLAVLPFFHSYGMSTMLTGGAALGATLIMQPRFEVRAALRAIEQHRPTVFHAVPAMLAALNNHLRVKPADLSSLKWVISGGAPLSPAVAEEFAGFSGALVVQGYGLSEASPVTHVGPLDGSNLPGSIGLPLPDTECRIVDTLTGTRDLPVGEVGELLIRGPQVMLGYWDNPAATAAAIREGWLHTGDLACVSASGFYRIVDRKKDLIITSGFNVYPADVEELLRGCECVQEVAVVGVPDDERGEIVKAFVVLKPGELWDTDKLKRYSKLHLAAHRRPRLWEQVTGDLPRNFLGKVIRRELRDNHGQS